MRKVINMILILVIGLIAIMPQVNAESEIIRIELNDEKITINGEEISTKSTENVYLTSKMNNGGTSSVAQEENINVANIINISKAGTFEITGKLSDGQISINANEISGEVIIILNNVNLTCKNAPAIFIYSKNIENENCKVTIKTAKDSVNTITGGKIKTSVEGWEDQDELLYYVEKAYSDEHEYYERYKYDGAISADISLKFEGEGTLNVVSNKKEGIESKMNITINSGILNIESQDDCVNACTDEKSIITINGGTIFAKVDSKAEEGDGIDSNGSLIINGGTIYAFACPGSDNGLDADKGIYINGGTLLATGDMQEEVKSSKNQTIIQMQLSTAVNEGETLVILDESDNKIFAFKTDRKISTFVYSSENLENTTYNVYSGSNVEGTVDKYNIYTQITNLDTSNLKKQENNNNGMRFDRPQDRRTPERFENMNTEMQEKLNIEEDKDLNQYVAIVIGSCLGTIIFIIMIVVIRKNIIKKKSNKKNSLE